MDQRKNLILVSVLFSCCFIGFNCNDGFVHFKSMKCAGNEKFVHLNFTCYARSYSRNFSSINFRLVFKKPLFVMIVSCTIVLSTFLYLAFLFTKFDTTLFYKYGTIYRQVMGSPKIDYCENVKITAKGNLLIYQLVNVMRLADPALVHDCPYIVKKYNFLPNFVQINFL